MKTNTEEEKQGTGPLSAPPCSPFTRCSVCSELYFGGAGSTPCCGGLSIVSPAPAWAEAALPLLDLILHLDPTTQLGAAGVKAKAEISDIRDQMEGADLPIARALEQAGNVAAHALGATTR